MAAPSSACAATSPPTMPTPASASGASTRCRAIRRSRSKTRFWKKRRRPGPASGGRAEAAARCGMHVAYDPKLDLLYIGVGNGSPWNQRIRSPGGGDNWFLSSIVALRPDTGEYVWHYQTTPGETWDYTATQPIMLADLKIGDDVRKVLMQAPKNGFFYVLDRQTGELISAKNYIDRELGERRRPGNRPADRRSRGAVLCDRQAFHRAAGTVRRPQLAADGLQPRHGARLHSRERHEFPVHRRPEFCQAQARRKPRRRRRGGFSSAGCRRQGGGQSGDARASLGLEPGRATGGVARQVSEPVERRRACHCGRSRSFRARRMASCERIARTTGSSSGRSKRRPV